MGQDHDINVLNSLITTTIDSANGFERSAEDADVPQFDEMFRSFAGERRQVVGMLQEHVRKLGGTPNDDGSLKANLHRRFVDLRDAISKGGDQEIIEEVERGEGGEAHRRNLLLEARSPLIEATRKKSPGRGPGLFSTPAGRDGTSDQ